MLLMSLKLSRTTRHRKPRATGLSSRIRTLTAMEPLPKLAALKKAQAGVDLHP
jgi:hypothetical protein